MKDGRQTATLCVSMNHRMGLASIGALALGLGFAGRANAAPASLPRGVPAGFVATPNGYFHPSCVVEIGEDEKVRSDGTVGSAKGGQRVIPPCQYPRYDRKGAVIPPDAPSPTINGWIESANNASEGPLNYISANWTVPAAPADAASQTLYYFPGLEPLSPLPSTGFIIMQPVLAWSGGAWSITSWNCCVSGTVVHAPSAPANAGDTLYGYVEGNNCDSNGVCSEWQVYTGDWTTGTSSTLNTSSYGNVMNWSFAAALEVYGVDTCDEFSATPNTTFDNLLVKSTSYLEVYPTWSTAVSTSDTPQCGYGVSAPSSSSVTLSVAP